MYLTEKRTGRRAHSAPRSEKKLRGWDSNPQPSDRTATITPILFDRVDGTPARPRLGLFALCCDEEGMLRCGTKLIPSVSRGSDVPCVASPAFC